MDPKKQDGDLVTSLSITPDGGLSQKPLSYGWCIWYNQATGYPHSHPAPGPQAFAVASTLLGRLHTGSRDAVFVPDSSDLAAQENPPHLTAAHQPLLPARLSHPSPQGAFPLVPERKLTLEGYGIATLGMGLQAWMALSNRAASMSQDAHPEGGSCE